MNSTVPVQLLMREDQNSSPLNGENEIIRLVPFELPAITPVSWQWLHPARAGSSFHAPGAVCEAILCILARKIIEVTMTTIPNEIDNIFQSLIVPPSF